MIITSAPGKIILFGEHAVVYDKLGIACSIDKRCFVKISPTNKNIVFIKAEDLGLKKSFRKKELSDFFEAINTLKEKGELDEIKEIYRKDRLSPCFFVIASIFRRYDFKGLKIEIESEIPKNLGSSSAVFSALALAISKFLGKKLSKKEISDFAFEGDIIAHGGTPSGIDNNVVTYGGYIQYKKSEGVRLPNINFKLPLVIVDSGEPAKTSKTVSFIRKLKEEKPKFVNPVLEKLEEISYLGIKALKSKNLKKFGSLMIKYYHELKKLKISTKKLDRIISLALKNKALGAKPTGGWGGGSCLVLAKNQKGIVNLIKIFQNNGFKAFQSKIGVEGVKLSR